MIKKKTLLKPIRGAIRSRFVFHANNVGAVVIQALTNAHAVMVLGFIQFAEQGIIPSRQKMTK